MARALLRIGRSRAAWETNDLEQVLKADFRLKNGDWDLRPSVYEVEADDDDALARCVVRIHAEHTASFLSPPHRGAPNFDTADLAPRPSSSLGETAFTFANQAHREIVLHDEAELRNLVLGLLRDRASREMVVTFETMLQYIAGVADDREWQRAVERNEKVKKWVDFARKKVPRAP